MTNKENLREKQVNLRLTQAEYERLTRTAQDHGIGRAAYLRMVLRGAWLREDDRKSEELFPLEFDAGRHTVTDIRNIPLGVKLQRLRKGRHDLFFGKVAAKLRPV